MGKSSLTIALSCRSSGQHTFYEELDPTIGAKRILAFVQAIALPGPSYLFFAQRTPSGRFAASMAAVFYWCDEAGMLKAYTFNTSDLSSLPAECRTSLTLPAQSSTQER